MWRIFGFSSLANEREESNTSEWNLESEETLQDRGSENARCREGACTNRFWLSEWKWKRILLRESGRRAPNRVGCDESKLESEPHHHLVAPSFHPASHTLHPTPTRSTAVRPAWLHHCTQSVLRVARRPTLV